MEPIAREFEQFERDENVFDIRVDDVPVWERLRFRLYYQLLENEGFDSAHGGADGVRPYLRGALLGLRNLLVKNPFLAPDSDVVFVGHPRRRRETDGQYWDVYCDPIHDECELNSVQFEADHDNGHRTPARTTNLRYLDVIKYGGDLLRKVGLFDPKIPDATVRRLERLEREIESRFGASFDLVSLVRRELADRNAKIGWYRRLLDRVDPDLLVLVVSYGKETLIEAAQSLDITVAELQHGIIHRSHFGYSFPGDRTKEAFPDHLLAFSPFWTDDIEIPVPDDRVHTFGYPYLQRKLEASSNVQRTNDLLFVSQRPVGEVLSELAVDAAESSAVDRDIVYKLHPSEYDEWVERYPRLCDSDIEVVDSDDPDLYQLFARCGAQVGYDSTALFEGVNFVDETYIYSDQLKHSMQVLVDSGGATQIDGLSQLERELDAPRPERKATGETYFSDVSPRERCEIIRSLCGE